MRREAGFTLLELLVALAVLGLLVTGLAEGVRFGAVAWRVAARDVPAAGFEPADRALRRLIEQAEPRGGPRGFAGFAHRLAFLTRLPGALATDGIAEAEVALGVDVRHRLVLRWTPAPHAVPLAAAPPMREDVLAADVAGLDLAYARPPAAGGGWVASWSGAAPPALVRLAIRFRPGDARRWPEIVAIPRRAPAAP